MAGIGFKLEEIADRQNIVDPFRALWYGLIITAGPWIITVGTISLILLFKAQILPNYNILDFRSILIYNFAFSLVFSSPITTVFTRFLADQTYKGNMSASSSVLYGATILTISLQMIPVIYFYFYYANLSLHLRFLAVINFMTISMLWVSMVYLTMLKNYLLIVRSFLIGGFFSVLFSLFGFKYGNDGILFGFNMGFIIIVGMILFIVLNNYPYPIRNPFYFMRYFKRYWYLALSGLLYTLATWVDKWIMWFVPEAVMLPNKMRLYHDYDTAAFLAYLTMIPTLAIFVVLAETSFYRFYSRLLLDAKENSPLYELEDDAKNLKKVIKRNSRYLVIYQSVAAALTIYLAPEIYKFFDLRFVSIPMFKFCVLGAALQSFILFLNIFLYYFSEYAITMTINTIFFLSNIIFTLISVHFGFDYYGYGYFASTLVTFFASGLVFSIFRHKLLYLYYL